MVAERLRFAAPRLVLAWLFCTLSLGGRGCCTDEVGFAAGCCARSGEVAGGCCRAGREVADELALQRELDAKCSCDGDTWCNHLEAPPECTPRAGGKAGDACGTPGSIRRTYGCERGLRCDETTKPGRCRTFQVGEACQARESCEDGSYCDSETKRCEARRTLGQRCVQSLSGQPCVAPLYCSSGQQECVARRAEGQRCDGVPYAERDLHADDVRTAARRR